MRLFLLFILSLFFSCKVERSWEVQKKFESYIDGNFDSYSELYREIGIWLKQSVEEKRNNTLELLFEPNYHIDKLILVNDDNTRLVGTVNISDSIHKNEKHDNVFMFWGVKIDDKWYFARGGTLHVPRAYYKYNIYESLSHYQLSYIGRDYFLKHFLHIDGDNISVNSDLIDEHVSIVDNFKYKEESDENWLKWFAERYKKKVSQEEIDRIKEDIKNEVEEDHKLPKEGTKAWKELYGNKIPLFEREEWKAYEANLKNTN